MKGDSNRIIGIILIVVLSFVYIKFFAPDASELEAMAQEGAVDSTAVEVVETNPEAEIESESMVEVPDSVLVAEKSSTFGVFAPAAFGSEKVVNIENEDIKLDISSKGGKIVAAHIKGYDKIIEGEKNVEIKEELQLLNNAKNKFAYEFILNQGLKVSSEDLFFEVTSDDKIVTLSANLADGAKIVQTYKLGESGYNVDYDVQFVGLNNFLDLSAGGLKLNWVNYLEKLEKNSDYERNYSTVYYKPADDSADHCSCTGDDTEEPEGKLKWISATNQFFNTSIIATSAFKSGTFETEVLDGDEDVLKKVSASVILPSDELTSFYMDMYIGPNKFENLRAYDVELTDIVPFGSSIFGSVNRWIIRPVFNFFSKYFNNLGIAIILLTLVVKLALYPLQYKMIHSQSKMGVLKPKLAALKEKHPNDQQKVQMETMKMYQEYGVNPLGGCMPIVLQMPIWFALYRFFPASIEFRQESFLWATDLSSYDVFASLPFELPFYGDHVSLFTILWAGTTVIYTFYNSRHMDMSANPAMKYMQYFMPIMFLFVFNNYASGLTCYLFFSNVLNIAQTVITKKVISDEKLLNELESNKNKPKKAGGFAARLEKAVAESQKMKEQQEKNKRKR
jgi:YidC/Oxa1 family membrane protein insertase